MWNTDSNGNYLSNIIGVGPATALALETIETTFNQDLNGDGTIGPPTVVIQTDGTTALTEIGNTLLSLHQRIRHHAEIRGRAL